MNNALYRHFLTGDIEGWAWQMRAGGAVLPTSKEDLEELFAYQLIIDHNVPFSKRIEVRDMLFEKKIDDFYPIRVLERIKARGDLDYPANHMPLHKLAKLSTTTNIVLICEKVVVMELTFMKYIQYLKSQVDQSKTSVTKREIWHLNGQKINLVLNDSDFPLPIIGVIFKEINNVV